jgi:hypothetical protein
MNSLHLLKFFEACLAQFLFLVSLQEDEAVACTQHTCPAWEGLGKGFLDLALGLAAPLDPSVGQRMFQAPVNLTDKERMANAVKLFKQELNQRLCSIMPSHAVTLV